ncbi:MAG: hypothetical protein GTN89_14580 [Acidobacteria bacterium]|nr:hypothetical protein [Acidobacteriota bacterium]NIQ31558.1 hypothetical protein [Acidobacteriota bacterium]
MGSTQAYGACQRCWLGLDPLDRGGSHLQDGTRVVSAVRDTDVARRFLLRAKFGRRPEIYGPMGRMMASALRDFPQRPDDIIPVPSHPWDTLVRGFAPGLELARVVSSRTGVPVRRLIHRGWRPWTRFKRLDRAGRRALALRAFRLPHDLRGRHVLLVDDLMTTGHTLLACARCCRSAGARGTSGLVWSSAS